MTITETEYQCMIRLGSDEERRLFLVINRLLHAAAPDEVSRAIRDASDDLHRFRYDQEHPFTNIAP